MGTHRFALVVALLVACGDDSGSARVDSGGNGDVISDGMGSDVFNSIPCGYSETMDATNFSPAAADLSGLTFSGQRIVLCGKFDTGHYGNNGPQAPADVVDADGIKFNVASNSPVIVHLLGD